MRLAWLTDPHLDFLDADDETAFIASLADAPMDALVITGDITDAASLIDTLGRFDTLLRAPVYVVLGNHDFYGSSIDATRNVVSTWASTSERTHWLPDAGVVRLGATSALVGHGGWSDGQYGDFLASPIRLNDYVRIAELAGREGQDLLDRLRDLGRDAARHLRPSLFAALEDFETVVVATHSPPFIEACWHDGDASLNAWTPHFTCGAIGELLLEAAHAFPARQMRVLCGHSHGEGSVQLLPNLRVDTGGAVYGAPALQPTLSLP